MTNETSHSSALPERLAIEPIQQPPRCAIRVPGSKSITNRALVLAALAGSDDSGPAISTLTGALRSEDTEIMVNCLRSLGFDVACDWPRCQVTVTAAGGKIPRAEAELFVGNSGTTMRFLTALVCLGKGRYRLDGIPRMRQRPIQDLLEALQALGVDAASENGDGCPPVVVQARGLPGGKVSIKGTVSSQFLSGLLMAAPLAQDDLTIEVAGPLVSQPYVEMTLANMQAFGAKVKSEERRFLIPGQQHYQARTFTIEPDASAASYFAGAAAILGGEVELLDLTPNSIQGDIRFLDILQQMGCTVIPRVNSLVVQASRLHGVDVDMNDISDTVMTLAVVACFADGPTTIRNVANIRYKETDRLAALAAELQRIGAGVEVFDDGLIITPQPLHGAEIETYNDHRMAMSFALAGLRVPGIVIKEPACVAKTYPEFFTDLEKLR